MTIRIILPKTKGIKCTSGTRVIDELTGAEIRHISRIELDMQAGDIVQAKITVCVGQIDNLDELDATFVWHKITFIDKCLRWWHRRKDRKKWLEAYDE